MRKQLNMNKGWKFHLGEIPFDPIIGKFDTYMHSKAQSARNAAIPNYYDNDFETVDLPHDYVILTKPSQNNNETNGGYFRDSAWYRRNFSLDKSEQGNRFVLMFDGAGMKTEVYVNGHFAGSNDSMYNSFYIDISPYVLYGKELNTVSVHITNDDLEGWWYEGAGIYRNVYLIKTNAIASDVWGSYVNPVKKDGVWEVQIENTVYNMDNKQEIKIENLIVNSQSVTIAKTCQTQKIIFGENEFCDSIDVENPVLWDLTDCVMYDVVTNIYKGEELVDTYITPFGFREINFDADKGFFLNGESVKLHGACIHQDHSHLGVAVPKSIMEFRLKQLKACGINGYRCAHNNPAPEILELCDKLGIVVLDENRWFNFSERTQTQLKNMVKRDRNHPSVILWSVGNEEPLQATKTGNELVRQMKGFINRLDETRPVSLALNGGVDGYESGTAIGTCDVVSVNYMIDIYDKIHKAHPTKSLIATESGASRNSRGIYFETEPLATAYDQKRASFGSAYIDAIRASEVNDYIAGTFVWAGIEYRGEAMWPVLASTSGLLDNCGMEKENFYMAKSIWVDEPMVYMFPHWDLFGHEGEIIDVCVYTNTEEVELFINDKSCGKKVAPKYYSVHFDVEYIPGKAKIVGYNGGKIAAEYEVVTSSNATNIVIAQKNNITNNGEDIVVLEVNLEDVNKNPLRDSNEEITFEVIGGNKLLTVDAADSRVNFNDSVFAKRMFGGKIHAYIKVEEGSSAFNVVVKAPNLNLEKTIEITPENVPVLERVEIAQSVMAISDFRIWPETNDPKAYDAKYNFADMNTSEPINLRNYSHKKGDGYVVFTGKTIIPKIPSDRLICMNFGKLSGEVAIKIFHDKNCWPNPTPDEFKTYYKFANNNEKADEVVEIPGFGANEKVQIVIQAKKDCDFNLDYVSFILK